MILKDTLLKELLYVVNQFQMETIASRLEIPVNEVIETIEFYDVELNNKESKPCIL